MPQSEETGSGNYRGAEVNATTPYGATALTLACGDGHLDVVSGCYHPDAAGPAVCWWENDGVRPAVAGPHGGGGHSQQGDLSSLFAAENWRDKRAHVVCVVRKRR